MPPMATMSLGKGYVGRRAMKRSDKNDNCFGHLFVWIMPFLETDKSSYFCSFDLASVALIVVAVLCCFWLSLPYCLEVWFGLFQSRNITAWTPWARSATLKTSNRRRGEENKKGRSKKGVGGGVPQQENRRRVLRQIAVAFVSVVFLLVITIVIIVLLELFFLFLFLVCFCSCSCLSSCHCCCCYSCLVVAVVVDIVVVHIVVVVVVVLLLLLLLLSCTYVIMLL